MNDAEHTINVTGSFNKDFLLKLENNTYEVNSYGRMWRLQATAVITDKKTNKIRYRDFVTKPKLFKEFKEDDLSIFLNNVKDALSQMSFDELCSPSTLAATIEL